jgi:hypothetical protein
VAEIDEELQMLDIKIKQLKLDYEQYFLGSRPREPVILRGEVQKIIVRYSNVPIQNTAARFRFNSLNSRFQAWKRQWDNNLRQIEQGTYSRHIFKADLHERTETTAPGSVKGKVEEGSGDRLFESYVTAAQSCGQNVTSLTPEKLKAVVKKQEAAVKKKLGCDRVKFKVVVQDGKVKLKASAAG